MLIKMALETEAVIGTSMQHFHAASPSPTTDPVLQPLRWAGPGAQDTQGDCPMSHYKMAVSWPRETSTQMVSHELIFYSLPRDVVSSLRNPRPPHPCEAKDLGQQHSCKSGQLGLVMQPPYHRPCSNHLPWAPRLSNSGGPPYSLGQPHL